MQGMMEKGSYSGVRQPSDFLEGLVGLVHSQQSAPADQVAYKGDGQRHGEPAQPGDRVATPAHLLNGEDVLRRGDGARHAPQI